MDSDVFEIISSYTKGEITKRNGSMQIQLGGNAVLGAIKHDIDANKDEVAPVELGDGSAGVIRVGPDSVTVYHWTDDDTFERLYLSGLKGGALI